MKAPADINQPLADRLLAEGRIPPDAHRRAIAQAMRLGMRMEDTLIDLSIVSEADLLKYLATMHKTKFVSTEKLFKATVDPRLVELIPPKLADLRCVFPVLYTADSDTLSVVTPTPDDVDGMKEVKLATGVRTVQPLIARPAAIRAAILRAYHGDPGGFPPLLQPNRAPAFPQPGTTGPVNPDPRASASSFAGQRQTGPHPYASDAIPLSESDDAPTHFRGPSAGTNSGAVELRPMADMGAIPIQHFPRAHQAITGPSPLAVAPIAPQPAPQPPPPPPVVRQQPPPPPQPRPAPPPVPQHRPPPQPMPAPMPVAHHAPMPAEVEPDLDDPDTSVRAATVPLSDFMEMVRVLINALDAQRDHLEAHSSTVADTIRKVCARMNIGEPRVSNYALAGLLHDLGKDGAHHITLLNVARNDACRAEAEQTHDIPRRYLAAIKLEDDTKAALRGMYERYDGRGLPKARAGEAIHEGARILSVCDCYVDLTTTRNNAAGRKLEPPAAMTYLRMHKGTLFDPQVLDALRAEIGVTYPSALLDQPLVLLVDPDAATTSRLEVQLMDHGFDVRTARDAKHATLELQQNNVTAVISEVDIEVPDAGLSLRQRAAAEPWGRNVVLWILHTNRTDPNIEQVAFDLQIDDLVPKPAKPDAFAAKIKQLVERKSRVARA